VDEDHCAKLLRNFHPDLERHTQRHFCGSFEEFFNTGKPEELAVEKLSGKVKES
jgi:hypothetical protein